MTVRRFAIIAAIGSLLIGWATWAAFRGDGAAAPAEPKSPLGLMTSLPIFWNESPDLGGMLADHQPVHWVKARLEERFDIVPLDTLAGYDTAEPDAALKNLDRLILAQPRTLPPADFAALDGWVRAGGMALIFADPMLTEHSDFGFGDKRRPQDVAMLSPIWARWGLEQIYEEDQPDGTRAVMIGSTALPIHKAGRFVIVPGGSGDCNLIADGVIAACEIGQGRALIAADASVLDREDASEASGEALDALISNAFGEAEPGRVQ